MQFLELHKWEVNFKKQGSVGFGNACLHNMNCILGTRAETQPTFVFYLFHS